VDGGWEEFAASLDPHYPPRPGVDRSAAVQVYGDCRILALHLLVRYEGNFAVLRLLDAVALPPMTDLEFVHACEPAGATGERPDAERFFAVVNDEHPDASTYAATSAWRFRSERIEAIDPGTVSCWKMD
jgi:hypothetical protein